MKTVYFYFDDSGVLHRNESSHYFVYAGYVFTSRAEVDSAKRQYKVANNAIKRATGRTDEIKAAGLPPKYKRALFNSVRAYESVSTTVDIRRVYGHILNNKKAICRYKDFVLKMCIKRKLEDMIRRGILSRGDDVEILIYIDEQLTATNGYYDLRDSIMEELQHGIVNFNYGTVYPNVFDGDVSVKIQYCKSENNYLIQASDIIANRIWTSYRTGDVSLRQIPNHMGLTFP